MSAKKGKTKVFIVAGARPNFMKVAPILRAMKTSNILKPVLVHTGQHYDYGMSQSFFDDLGIPEPDIFLNVGSGSHAEQTAKVMVSFEKEMIKEKPGLVVVVGDVNSTVACAIVAAKLLVPVAHVEAGLRSFDRAMPEEINRILTDSISDFLFITEPAGRENLLREGVDKKKIHFVGNVMIDTLAANLRRVRSGEVEHPLGDAAPEYAALTLHRPSNVDDKIIFTGIVSALEKIAREIPVIFPAHPRTVKNITKFKLKRRFKQWKGGAQAAPGLYILEPLGYLQFLALTAGAKFVLTDSGGIQEETTYLGIPCITIRENTERPVTIDVGANILTGPDSKKIVAAAEKALKGNWKKGGRPRLWDGKAAVRIVKILELQFS